VDPYARAARFAARQHGALSSTQAKTCGLTRNQIRQLVRSGRWRVGRHAIYVVDGAPCTWRQCAWISLLACGADAVLSYRAAAYLHGLIDEEPPKVDVTMAHRSRNGRPNGVAIHRAVHLGAGDRRRVNGFPVTSPARTLVDLAGALEDRPLGRVVDRALLRGLVTIPAVRTYIKDRQLQRKRGVGRLVKVLDDREFGVPESELERRTLELIAGYGLPAPSRQQRVGPHRVDFMYPDRRVVEIGRAHV
jgi:hypothetical protein